MQRIHYGAGVVLTLFIGLHLINHACSMAGSEAHIRTMHTLRLFYRHPVAESLLLTAVVVQIVSGLRLFKKRRQTASTFFERLQVWTGAYLAAFLVIHVGAVLAGRLFLHLDTNFYFGVAGLNTFPFNLFFIPYYAFAIVAFFGHLSALHGQKMRHSVFGISPEQQAKILFLSGVAYTLLVLYGLTDHFQGVLIPAPYRVLIGQ